MRTRLEQGLTALHLSPTPSETLERYCHLLLEQNQVMNLTAITDPDQVVDLHMLDSAALLTLEDFSGKKVIDVGTGAGFPGMVLKVVESTIQLTLLDSLAKRVNWLSELSVQLGAAPVECIHGRAEEQALLEGYREVLYGDGPVLCKMKGVWAYLIQSFTNYQPYQKIIRKTRRLSEYESTVNALFHNEALIPGAGYRPEK